MLSFEWQVGLRYTRAGRLGKKNRFISFIAGVSMIGIAIGVAALIIVLSVMNGFQKEVRDRMLSVLPHIEVFTQSDSQLENWQSLATTLKQNPKVTGTAPYVAAQGLLTAGETVRGVFVRGVDPAAEAEVSDIAKQMVLGQLSDLHADGFGVVLGKSLAQSLGVRMGDSITMLSPAGQMSPAGVLPRVRVLKVVGIADTGYFEFDSGFAWMHIQDAAKLFRTGMRQGLRLRLSDLHLAPSVTRQLAPLVPGNMYLSDWTQENRTWFAAVQVEKSMMAIILGIIVAVAAFNLLSTLVMTVADKQADIAILRTLGASPHSVMKIFVIQGALVGLIGMLSGVGLGCLIAYNVDVIVPFLERLLRVQFLPADVYLISRMPSDPQAQDIVTIACMSFVMALLATLYPSWRASKVQPAQALRYE